MHCPVQDAARSCRNFEVQYMYVPEVFRMPTSCACAAAAHLLLLQCLHTYGLLRLACGLEAYSMKRDLIGALKNGECFNMWTYSNRLHALPWVRPDSGHLAWSCKIAFPRHRGPRYRFTPIWPTLECALWKHRVILPSGDCCFRSCDSPGIQHPRRRPTTRGTWHQASSQPLVAA
jgi:hypothetical protein